MSNFPTLQQVCEQVWAKSANKTDYSTTLGDFIGGMADVRTVGSPTGDLILTPYGFKQLTRDRLGLPLAIFEDGGISPSTKLQILQDKIRSGYGDDLVKVRIAGNQIEAVVSDDYSFFDNGDLCTALIQLQLSGNLSSDALAMQHGLSPDGRNLHMRIISPDTWDFTIGENGGSKNFHGNLILTNNELAQGSFSAQVAITRAACLNSTIGQSLFRVDHRFAGHNDFVHELQKAVAQIGGYSREMGEIMKHTQNVNIEAPLLIFQKIGEELGIPQYAMDHARSYWENDGSRNSLYDITQAVAAGAREVTEPEGRRKPNWQNRSLIEQKLWGLTTELQNVHAEGRSLEDWYLVGEEGIRQRILSVVKGYQNQAPVVEEIVFQIERLEI